jgi:hypothetical protein
VSEYAEINDEVMTYAPVRNLGAEVAELEAQRRQLQRDNAELREKWNAVPVDALIRTLRPEGAVDDDADRIEEWILAMRKSYQGVQHAGA